MTLDRFRVLGIGDAVLQSLEEQRFEQPTEIQSLSIPAVLGGRDVIAESATGSGKTLAFGVGIIQQAERGKGIQALVMTPTRELAEQVAKALRLFSRHKPLEIADVYGGVSINPQIERLRTADVVVGTPGRLLDHLERGTVQLSQARVLVLDEADRMLDMGFIEDVERIIRHCPAQRQTLLFSATMPHEVVRLSRRYMKDPVRVSAAQHVDPRKLAQAYYDVPPDMKISLLVHLLKHDRSGLVMVFCNSRSTTDFVASALRQSGVEATAIHGGFSQDKRTRTMTEFHSRKTSVLVCTDVAARGLDIRGVSHVYNYDIPKEPKQYIHRIGRTARAGREGKAISLLSPKDFENFTHVLRDNDIDIQKAEMPPVRRLMVRRDRSPSQERPGDRLPFRPRRRWRR